MADTNHAAPPSTGTVERRLKEILAAATVDPALRRRLQDDPAAVLAQAGLPVADGVRVTVEEAAMDEVAAVLDRSTQDHIVLPLPPRRDGVLSDDQLDAVAGGGVGMGLLAGAFFPINALITIGNNLTKPQNIGNALGQLAQGVADHWNAPN
ncbi:hypothetical protein [Azospirillum sp. ST 5-10]|uniref:hypothetical protein n=1 Tax=unclassified Azospirillum TaxID=2630922 RepID=UPI003F49F9E8